MNRIRLIRIKYIAALALGELGHATSRVAVLLPLVAAPLVYAEVDLATLKQRVQTLNERVTELAGKDNLLDTLYFAWSDRPYARATLAILVKVAVTLDREADGRGRGNGKIDDAKVESMMNWSDNAIQRVIRAEPSPDFRPDRMRILDDALVAEWSPLRLYAFVDEATGEGPGTIFRDLDLLASLGQRIYPRFTQDINSENAELVARRAASLGLQVAELAFVKSEQPQTSSYKPPPQWQSVGREIGAAWLGALCDARVDWGTFDIGHHSIWGPTRGEPFAAGLARRALLRGVFGTVEYAVASWTVPTSLMADKSERREVRAAMWVHALDGQCMALLLGWIDKDAEESSAWPSVLQSPAVLETVVHTALDLLRFGSHFEAFAGKPAIAFEVGEDAVSGNSWAPWAASIWDALVSRQVRYDVVPQADHDDRFRRRYSVVIPLARPADGQTEALIGKIERRLAQFEEHVHRLTAREMNGTIAADMYVRVGNTPSGKACAAVVNLSDRPRVLKLRGSPAIGAARDVNTDQQISEPDQRLEFAPWQVRLLWPRE